MRCAAVSAYDMAVSDSMYGAANRYVTRERVEAMLDYEYLQCILTLRKQRGANTSFFAFADTVVRCWRCTSCAECDEASCACSLDLCC